MIRKHEHRLRSAILSIICCLPIGAVAQQRPSSIEKEHQLEGQFKLVSKTEDIPAKVKHAFSKISREPSFAMANPGRDFQATDYVIDRALPWRRLVFAGTQDEKWFVHYEHGGYAHSYYVATFKVNSHGEANFEWGCSVEGAARTLGELRTMVAACRLAKADSHW
jgi:hypothetical protein